MTSKTRLFANIITNTGDVKSASLDNVPASGLDSAQVLAIAGGFDSAQVLSISGTGSTFRDAAADPILTIEAGTTLHHSGWLDSAGTTSPPFVNAAQIRK